VMLTFQQREVAYDTCEPWPCSLTHPALAGFMAHFFGENGPTSVEALSNPTRRSTTTPNISSARPSYTESDVQSFRRNSPTLTDVGATDRPEDTTPQQQTPPPRKTRVWPSKSPRDADELSVSQFFSPFPMGD